MTSAINRDPRVSVVVGDDHELVREGLRKRIGAHEGMTVVGEAVDAATAIAEVSRHVPDVVVLDHQPSDSDGLDLRGEIHAVNSRTRCILYTATIVEEAEAHTADAAAVVLRKLVGDQLVATIGRLIAEDLE